MKASVVAVAVVLGSASCGPTPQILSAATPQVDTTALIESLTRALGADLKRLERGTTGMCPMPVQRADSGATRPMLVVKPETTWVKMPVARSGCQNPMFRP
jgi:hypothetical protein